MRVSEESCAEATQAETSLAAVPASLTADQEVSVKTFAEKLKISTTLATDSLTTFNTSLHQLYPARVRSAKLEEMKQALCPCVTFLVAEVGCTCSALGVSRVGKSVVARMSLSAHSSPPESLLS